MKDMKLEEMAKQAEAAGTALIEALEGILTQLKGEGDSFDAPHLLELMTRYAWGGQVDHRDESFVSERMHELSLIEEFLGGKFILPNGENLLAEADRSIILRVIRAASARSAIDQGEMVSVEDLAALANVTDRTVRGAISSANANPIPITKQGHRTFIEGADALRWLSERNDFVQTKFKEMRPSVAAMMGSFGNRTVGQMWAYWRNEARMTIEDLAKALGWSEQDQDIYRSIEADGVDENTIPLKPAFWKALAAELDAENPDSVAAITYSRLVGEIARAQIRSEIGFNG